MKCFYETLGVAKDATPEEIATAYRKLARKHHPDAGGDKEIFAEISQAYEVVGDPEKLARYDEHGSTDDDTNMIRQTIVDLVQSVLVNGRDNCENPIKRMCEEIDAQRSRHRNSKIDHMRKLDKVKQRLERFNKSNASSKNVEAKELIAGILANAAEQLEAQIVEEQHGIELGDKILAFLNDIKWDGEFQMRAGFYDRPARSAFQGLPNFITT